MASRKEYEMLMKISAELGSNYDHTFTKAQAQIIALQREIQNLSRLQADITAYQKQQDVITNTEKKLAALQLKYQQVQADLQRTGNTNSVLQNRMVDLQGQIDRTSNALQNHKDKLSQMDTKLKEAGVDTSKLAGEQARLKGEIEGAKGALEAAGTEGYNFSDMLHFIGQGFSATIVAAAFKEIYDQISQCVDASVEFETAMAGVRRTVGGSDSEIAKLADAFQDISETIPITTTELGAVATTAGQLGIAADSIEEFTTVMSMLGTATDMTAEDAATALAQFANITGLTDYTRLGSTVAALGDETATTASKVVEMSKMMAAAANMAGFSETDILALSAAVGSLGIEASAGGTAMSTTIQKLYMAIEAGGDDLTKYAKVAGMSASEFKKSWGEDAVGTFNTFIKGLNDTERNGKSAILLLNELGISNIRQSKAILGLANSEGLLDKTIAKANEAWEQNTALQDKASVMYDTTASQLQIMKNSWNNLRIEIGDYITPALKEAYEYLGRLAQRLEKPIELANKYRNMFSGLEDSAQTMLDVAVNTKVAQQSIDEYLKRLGKAENAEEYQSILQAMVDTIPELAEVINLETGEIDGGTEAIKRNTEAWAENQRMQAIGMYQAEAEAARVKAEADQKTNEILARNAQTEINVLQSNLDQATADWQAFVNSHSVNGVFNPYNLSAEDQATYKLLEERRSTYVNQISDATERLKDYNKAIEESGDALREATVYAEALKEAFLDFEPVITPSSEYMTMHGYASGTLSAAPGWHWVGEAGPELVNFGGGESVLDAKSSAAAAAGISVSVAFNIEGNADVGVLQDYADDFAGKVLAVIENAQNDALRRAYV